MNWLLCTVALMVVLFAYVLNNSTEQSVYACSEVTKSDPIEVQKLCDRARKSQPWMK